MEQRLSYCLMIYPLMINGGSSVLGVVLGHIILGETILPVMVTTTEDYKRDMPIHTQLMEAYIKIGISLIHYLKETTKYILIIGGHGGQIVVGIHLTFTHTFVLMIIRIAPRKIEQIPGMLHFVQVIHTL